MPTSSIRITQMENEMESRDKQIEEIDLLIQKLSNSSSEFRDSIREIVFIRLHRFFQRGNKQVRRDTDLKLLSEVTGQSNGNRE